MNHNKKTFWLMTGLGTLMIVGAATSFASSQGTQFFKGTTTLGSLRTSDFSTSVLKTDSASKKADSTVNQTQNSESFDLLLQSFAHLAEAKAAQLQQEAAQLEEDAKVRRPEHEVTSVTEYPSEPITTEDDFTPTVSPVTEGIRRIGAEDFVPIQEIVTQEAPLEPAFNEVDDSTCESEGIWTYTGPDRPGLLSGMCIECSTQDYILSNGTCTR